MPNPFNRFGSGQSHSGANSHMTEISIHLLMKSGPKEYFNAEFDLPFNMFIKKGQIIVFYYWAMGAQLFLVRLKIFRSKELSPYENALAIHIFAYILFKKLFFEHFAYKKNYLASLPELLFLSIHIFRLHFCLHYPLTRKLDKRRL